MKKQIFALLFVSSLIFPQSTFATRSITISSDKSSLFGSEEMNVSASVSGFTNGEKIYLKGAFFKDGSTNYLGYTKNGDSWIKNSTTATDQRQVEIGNWDANVVIRSDFDDSGYAGKGDYKFKLGYYYLTSGGNLSSVNWSDNNLSINLDQPSPTPTAAQASTMIASTTLKSSTPIKTPTPTRSSLSSANVSTSKTINVPTASISDKIAQNSKIASDFARIRNVTPTNVRNSGGVKVLGVKDKTSAPLGALAIIGGLILFASVGGWYAYKNLDRIKIWIEK